MGSDLLDIGDLSEAEIRAYVATWSEEQVTAWVDRMRPKLSVADLRVRARDVEDSPLVPLVWNPVQSSLAAELAATYDVPPAELWRARGVRENVLKARQQGISTFWLGLEFLAFCNLPYFNGVVITHRADSTRMLWARVQQWETDRKASGRVKFGLKYSNRRELVREDTGSSFFIGTAGEDDLARSGTLTHVHLTETAFWPTGSEEIITGVLGTLPLWGNLVEESTANGLGPHYRRWKTARDAGKRAIFFAWHQTPEYSLLREPKAPTLDNEDDLRAAYGLTDGQVWWYRLKAQEFEANGKGEKLPQEYPSNPQEAFVASGKPVYDTAFLMRLIDRLTGIEPLRVEKPGATAWEGIVTTYADAESGAQYIIVADVAEGLDAEGDHDWSVAHVYDLDSWEQVCHYRGRPDTHKYGEDLANLGRMYNGALIAVERTGPGLATLNTLVNTCLYENLYFHADFDDPGFTKDMMRPGWPATKRTRAQSIEDSVSIVRDMAKGEEGFYWNHANTIEEMVHFVKLPGSKTGAESGSHDDEVTCVRIAAVLVPQYTGRRKPPKRKSRPYMPKVSDTSYLRGGMAGSPSVYAGNVKGLGL